MRTQAIIRTLLLLVLLALSADAQQKHVFHPERDLPGFEASDLSEYSDLYQTDEFKSQDGKEVGEDELAQLRQRWAAEKERVKKRIAVLVSDARERWTWQLGKRLARNSGFTKLHCKVLHPVPGIVLVLQPPEKEEPDYEKRMTDFYVPYVERLEANFIELVAKPAALVRHEDQPLTALALLSSRGDFDKLLPLVRDPGDDASHSGYDYTLQLALGCEDPDDADAPPVAKRAAVLYQVAKELQHAYLAVNGNRPGSIWLYHGLSFLLATHDATGPDSLGKRALRPDQVDQLVKLLQTPDARELLILPLDELAGLRSWQEYTNGVEERARRKQLDPPGTDAQASAFFAQCDLWAHFLVDGAGGAYRKPFTEFLKAAFHGKGDAEDLRKAFVAFDPRSFSRDFLRWTCDQYEHLHPGQSADRSKIDALFPVSSAPAPRTGEQPAQPAGALALVPSGFSPAMLAPDADDAEAQSAHALLGALEGDIDGAEQELRALAQLASEAPWPARLQNDIARVAELRKLRDGYLAYLKQSGAVLMLKYKGRDLPAVVESVEGKRVRLRGNELGVPSIDVADIDPLLVARMASKPEMQGEAQPWARAFACILGGDSRWDRLLKDDAPGASELRADAKEYKERMRTSGVARELFALSKLPLPRDAKEAGPVLERVRALLASGAGTGLLTRRMDALRQFALAALAGRASENGLGALLHGKWNQLPDGRGKLTYEFEDPAEEQDWVKLPGFRKGERDSMGKIAIDESATHFTVVKGAFQGAGSTAYRLLVGFSGPVTLRYTFRYLQVKTKYNTPYFAWMICDDEQDSGYRSPPSGEIFVEDHAHYDVRGMQLPDRPVFDWNKDWTVEFSYDGTNLTSKLNGKQRAALPAGQLTGGAITLLVHSELGLVFQRVEIEGRVAPDALEQLRSAWAAQELKKLGFP